MDNKVFNAGTTQIVYSTQRPRVVQSDPFGPRSKWLWKALQEGYTFLFGDGVHLHRHGVLRGLKDGLAWQQENLGNIEYWLT